MFINLFILYIYLTKKSCTQHAQKEQLKSTELNKIKDIMHSDAMNWSALTIPCVIIISSGINSTRL